MKTEAKVAWPKSHPINLEIQNRLRRGEPLDHQALIAAVEDPDGQRVFRGNRLVRGDGTEQTKGDFVVFQYGIYLRDAEDRVACFKRNSEEQQQERITRGASLLLGSSTPIDPRMAVQTTLRDTLCVSGRRSIGEFQPTGVVWNPLAADEKGPRPTYLTAIYEHRLQAGLRLFGRWKRSPDSFHDWVPIAELPSHLEQAGFIDQALGRGLASESPQPEDEGEGRLIYSPRSKLAFDDHDPVEYLEYSYGHNVFISHAAEDNFAAYALHRLLVEESSRSIYPTVDLEDLWDGERTSKIERLVNQCHALVVIITPLLLEKSRRIAKLAAEAEEGDEVPEDWVRNEVQLALDQGKQVFGFKLGTLEAPDYLPDDLVANTKALYTDWQREVQRLITSVQSRFGS